MATSQQHDDGKAGAASFHLEEVQTRPSKKMRYGQNLFVGAVGVAAVVGLTISWFWSQQLLKTEVKLVFLHINDHHGHLPEEPLEINRSLTKIAGLARVPDNAVIKVNYGGYPMIAQVVRHWEEEAEAVNQTLFRLHNGDALTGTAYYSLFEHGEVDALMMSELCFDAFVLGNHEFDHGDENLAYFLESLDANSSARCANGPPTVLGSNVRPGPDSPLQGKLKDWEIIERGGVRLGLVGVDTKAKTMESSSPTHGTVLLDEIPAAQAAIDELQAQGIKHIVLMSHVGYTFDIMEASQKLRGVDVIMGGDSHSLLSSELTGGILKGWSIGAEANYPSLQYNPWGQKVCVVQAWDHGHIVGRLEVEFNEHGDVLSCSGTPFVPYDEDSFTATWDVNGNENEEPLVDNDLQVVKAAVAALPGFESAAGGPRWAEVKEKLDVYSEEVEEKKSEFAGTSADMFYKERTPGQFNNAATWEHGNDVAAPVGEAFVGILAHACLSIFNGGGIREDIRAGPVTYNDIQVVMPYTNTIVEMSVTGQQIKDVLEQVMALIKASPDRSGSFPYGWGIRYEIDVSQAVGSMVSSIQTNCRVEGDWVDLDLLQTYVMATTSYTASGKDGWDVFDDLPSMDTGSIDLDVMLNHVRALTARGEALAKKPIAEYAVQRYIDADGCDHSEFTFGNCPIAPRDGAEDPDKAADPRAASKSAMHTMV